MMGQDNGECMQKETESATVTNDAQKVIGASKDVPQVCVCVCVRRADAKGHAGEIESGFEATLKQNDSS